MCVSNLVVSPQQAARVSLLLALPGQSFLLLLQLLFLLLKEAHGLQQLPALLLHVLDMLPGGREIERTVREGEGWYLTM